MFSAARDKRNCFDKKCEYISSINSTHSYMLDAAVNMLLSGRLMLGESKPVHVSKLQYGYTEMRGGGLSAGVNAE